MSEYKKTALCLGGNGFICHHLARRLKSEGFWVRVVDIEHYNYGTNDYADEIIIGDLRDKDFVESVIRLNENYEHSFLPMPYERECEFTYIFQMAADMGGSLYVFGGDHDADIMQNSSMVNLNVLQVCANTNFKGKLFYSSSACIYPKGIQEDTFNHGLKESSAWPADPDSCYGVEKLFSEKLYEAYYRNNGINIRIARFHNIYGPEGTYKLGREKAPAAMCRKAAEPKDPEGVGCRNFVEVFGDGLQTRSFLFIDDCIDAVMLLIESDYTEPINIGSEEMVSINDLAKLAIDLSGKKLIVNNVHSTALGVRGRNSDNTLARKVLNGWEPKYSLKEGMKLTFNWINQQINGK